MRIGLLGAPRIEADGSQRPPPRGRKPWALLAYLAVTGRPHDRERLAQLLFGQADDPMAALRWNLAELRRLLGAPGAFRGRQVALEIEPTTVVDVHVLTSGSWTEAV